MASHRKHIEKAQHNEGLLQPLFALDTHPDWYITTAFYAGVHWIRAYLALNGIGQGEKDQVGYTEFDQKLRDVSRSTGVSVDTLIREFGILHRLGRDARYVCQTKHWYDQRVSDADAALKAIRDFVTANGINP
ncbi:hypothetical protein QR90_06815 [Deinococcus radiopugnans]|uniref:HEPN domain-containing protein n=1 Tax=Deinococcus radiopugnans TaxID=57497 RepID=A0A0A7KFN1_9DEIO|nr:hypothetical protein [Deinococcus radiopugnans]AIZ44880.1 hypothetical protein QR90_06815 [Deinococcus radiopugnans]